MDEQPRTAIVSAPDNDFPVAADAATIFSVVDPPPAEEESYRDWFRRVVIRNRWLSWFTTFYFHWMALLIMAAIIVHGPEDTAGLLINATFAALDEPEPRPFEIVTTLPEPEPKPDAEPAQKLIAETEVAEVTERDVAIDQALIDELAIEDSVAESAAPPPSAVAAMPTPPALPGTERNPYPAPPQAISEGSFTVWTEPSQPKAGEPYRIVIQVKLPEGIKRYSVADLQGVVVGSDGYRKPIPGHGQGSLPIEHGYARFIVPVVSADEHVCDTVFIRSRLLKETQKLVLQF